jgi:hypothetical protein
MFLSIDRTLVAARAMSASSDRTRVRAMMPASGAEAGAMRRPDDRSHEVSEPDLGAVVEVPREVLIGELLGLCDGFFRVAGPVVRAELLAFLVSRGLHPGTALGWFADVLSLTAAAGEGRATAGGVCCREP